MPVVWDGKKMDRRTSGVAFVSQRQDDPVVEDPDSRVSNRASNFARKPSGG